MGIAPDLSDRHQRLPCIIGEGASSETIGGDKFAEADERRHTSASVNRIVTGFAGDGLAAKGMGGLFAACAMVEGPRNKAVCASALSRQ
jgi:hypothetical protein